MVAIMYVEHVRHTVNARTYEQVLLRETYREAGAPRSAVKHRTLLNLTHYDPADVAAIEWALKHKGSLEGMGEMAFGAVRTRQGPSVGSVWVLYQVAERIGLAQALGPSQEGRRALWQVLARLIDQGSRLSAVRLAQEHGACAVLGLEPFDEEALYRNLDWLDERQAHIEQALYRRRGGSQTGHLFLYDVTSSYLEGVCNAYAAFGYNRDGKRRKRQIVVGLLTDAQGTPLSTQVFAGNTQDPKTVEAQIRKLVERFGVKEVTLVGDRGMLKSLQLDLLVAEGFHYLTAITKPQIDTLLKAGVLQMEMFDEHLGEVCVEEMRYLVRRNPMRVDELAAQREDKFHTLVERARERTCYLAQHRKAQPDTALGAVRACAQSLLIASWAHVDVCRREVRVVRDDAALADVSRLDGCYVLKTDVAPAHATAETLHARYKDLGLVEQAFRTSKTGHLELRPIYVRTKAHTRGHVFVVMLAYLLRRELARAWRKLDTTVEEGLEKLNSLCATEVIFPSGARCLTIPEPRDTLACLFDAMDVSPPMALPKSYGVVATKQKLPPHRKRPETA